MHFFFCYSMLDLIPGVRWYKTQPYITLSKKFLLESTDILVVYQIGTDKGKINIINH